MTYRQVDHDNFEDWRTSDIGEAFFGALRKEAQRAKDAWVAASWEGGKIDPLLLASLKERATLAQQLAEVPAVTLEEMLNDEE